MAESEILRTMDSASQERWNSWALGIARKETDRQSRVIVTVVAQEIGGRLSPIIARLAELESEVALLRAVGPKRSKNKGKPE